MRKPLDDFNIADGNDFDLAELVLNMAVDAVFACEPVYERAKPDTLDVSLQAYPPGDFLTDAGGRFSHSQRLF